MALMRIGASLGERGLLPPIGPVSKEDMAALEDVQGLVGVVEKDIDDEDCDEHIGDDESLSRCSQQATQANADHRGHVDLHARHSEDEIQSIVQNRTDVESQFIDNEEKQQTRTDAEDENRPYIQLALGAPGAITPDLVKRRDLYKKAWAKLCDWCDPNLLNIEKAHETRAKRLRIQHEMRQMAHRRNDDAAVGWIRII